jgi:transcriptional regulator with XRE-family HTH domain
MSDLKIDKFGERLLLLIKSNNLNQSDFANRLSASPSFVSDLIRGVRKPGTEILIRIKNNFNVSIDWLLFGEDVMQEERLLNVELLKAIALRVDIVKAALSGNSQAISTLNAMCPSIKDKLITELSLSYTLDSNQITKDVDVINKLYVTFLNSQINDDLYKKIIESAVDNILENPIDPLLKMNQSNQPK